MSNFDDMNGMADIYFSQKISADMQADQRDRETRVWEMADGRQIPIVQMEEGHLLNSLRAVRGGTVAGKGTHVEDALLREVKRRGLEPLPDFSCPEEAKATAAVSKLYLHWRRLTKTQQDALIPTLRAFLHDDWIPSDRELDDAQKCDKNEYGMLIGLRAYAHFGTRVDDEAAKRLAEVFGRWTVAMKIDEKLA